MWGLFLLKGKSLDITSRLLLKNSLSKLSGSNDNKDWIDWFAALQKSHGLTHLFWKRFIGDFGIGFLYLGNSLAALNVNSKKILPSWVV